MFLEHCDWKGLRNQIVESLLVAILACKEHHNTTYSPEKCWCHPYTKEKDSYWENFPTGTLHQPPATISKKHWLKDCNWGQENSSNNADRMWKTHFLLKGETCKLCHLKNHVAWCSFLWRDWKAVFPQYENSSSSSQSPYQMSELIPIVTKNPAMVPSVPKKK